MAFATSPRPPLPAATEDARTKVDIDVSEAAEATKEILRQDANVWAVPPEPEEEGAGMKAFKQFSNTFLQPLPAVDADGRADGPVHASRLLRHLHLVLH